MTNDKMTFEYRLAEEINEDLLNASDEEILNDAEAAGLNIRAFANRMRSALAPAPRMAENEAPKKDAASNTPSKVRPLSRAKELKESSAFVPDTIAARQGKALSNKDKVDLEQDLEDLFDDDAWNDQDEHEER